MQHTDSDTVSKGARTSVATVESLATEISTQANGSRCVVAIAGAPGSGKSTISKLLRTELEVRHKLATQIVPMDGFHFDNAILEQRNLLPRKGSPETFDVGGLENILMRLTSEPAVEVMVPVFDRERELSRASAREIPASTEVILVEGNYLLLDSVPWGSLKRYFDISIMIHCEKPVLRQRLMNRWLDLNFSQDAARDKVEANDLPNAVTVMSHSLESDLTFISGSV